MEKYLIDDGTYKFIYKLPSNSILEFDFSFKKGENFENILFENFEQEKIPKILLNDLNILMIQFLNEERKAKKVMTKLHKEGLNSKYFVQDLINKWLSIKIFQNHIECNIFLYVKLVNSNNNKHISHVWQKLAIIKFYNRLEKLSELEKKVNLKYNDLISEKENYENELRNKQEREMQEANLKNLQLDLIVNRHIGELSKFIKEFEEKLIIFKSTCHDEFIKIIEESFQIFIESVDPALIIYNSENKLIQIKTKGTNINLNESPFIETKSVKSIEKKVSYNQNQDLFFEQKIKFGIFNKNKLSFYFYKVSDHVENEIKIKFSHFLGNLNIQSEEITINDILKSSDNFGQNVYAMLNFFTFDKTENKIIHSLDSLNYVISKIQNEFFYDTIIKFFSKIESQCRKGNLPYEFDIFTTRHTALQSFDILISMFLDKETHTEENFNIVIKNILYFVNIFKINILIIPLDKIIEKFYNVYKYSESKSFMKSVKSVIALIKTNFSLIIKSGM